MAAPQGRVEFDTVTRKTAEAQSEQRALEGRIEFREQVIASKQEVGRAQHTRGTDAGALLSKRRRRVFLFVKRSPNQAVDKSLQRFEPMANAL
eukprot:gene7546-40704_t